MGRTLETATAAAGFLALAIALALQGAPELALVLAFGGAVILGEHLPVFVHDGAAVSAGFMLVMATIAVAPPGKAVISAALVGGAQAIYLPSVRRRLFSRLTFNFGQHLLASVAAALAFIAVEPLSRTPAAVAAALAYGVVNLGLVLSRLALLPGESFRKLWHDMLPVTPNYLSFGLLGLVMGLVCQELGAWTILLLAIPMGIGRWTFRSFERTRQAHDAAIRVFIRLIEAKDPYTAGHTERVAKYAVYVGEELGLGPDRIEHLRGSALMHDVGKLAVPGHLLNKPGRLTPDEWQIVRSHNAAGIGILGQVRFMRTMAVTASDAHGRYEHGDQGIAPELVLEAHIVAVADAFDAMTSTRPYRRALDQDVAFAELRDHAGSQFNPACVEALIATIEERGERYGLGFEHEGHAFATPPPVVGVGSAGLGDLEQATP